MIILKRRIFSEDSKNLKDIAIGTGSGAILGAATGKRVNNVLNQVDLEVFLENNPDKNQIFRNIERRGKKGSRLARLILDEAAERVNPQIKLKRMKKGALIGAGSGLLLSSGVAIKRKIKSKKSKSFSESLPSDWNELDEKFISTAEKGKRKVERVSSDPSKRMVITYTKGGALAGGINGYRHGKLYKLPKTSSKLIGKTNPLKSHPELARSAAGAVTGALVGASYATLINQQRELVPSKYSPEKLKKMGENEKKRVDAAIRKYKKLETSKEREEFRKKLGSKF